MIGEVSVYDQPSFPSPSFCGMSLNLYQYAQITHWKIDESDHKPLIFSA